MQSISEGKGVRNEAVARIDTSVSGNSVKIPDRAKGRQRLVFTDPVAFRYLLEDPCTRVIERETILEGFELYLVEQWACSRTHPTFIISTYTGQPQHRVSAGTLSVPNDENAWSPRLRTYLKAVSTFHARRKETNLGMIMVTNLSSFPSALTVIQIPNGNFKEYREMFIVNENLKRLGCSGRAGLTLSAPTSATESKFMQLYHIHETVSTSKAVIELVKLCQVALVMYDKLAPEYADGLLCDITERAINDWWAKIGTDFYSTEPTDGILGPTTASAILGLYVGARNRLNAYGAAQAKDAFDVRYMKRAIGYFQRANKLSDAKPRRLDLITLQRLRRSTNKAAHSDRWGVPRAVKSTVQEYGGKGGEMVIDMVGRDKSGIAEVETLDMKKFAEKVPGDHGRWLWQGKSKKAPPLDMFGALAADEEGILSGDERIGVTGTVKKREGNHESKRSNAITLDSPYNNPLLGSQSSLEVSDKDPALRRTVLKNVTGRMSDARSGLGRFRDAVAMGSLRSHHGRHQREASDPRNEAALDRGTRETQTTLLANPYEAVKRQDQNPIKVSSSEKTQPPQQNSEKITRSSLEVPRLPQQSTQVSIYPLSSGGSSLVLSLQNSEGDLKQDGQLSPRFPTKGDEVFGAKLRTTRSIGGIITEREHRALEHGPPGLPRQASCGPIEQASTWLQTVEKVQKSLSELTSSQAMSEEQQSAIRSQQALEELRRMAERTSPMVEVRLQELGDLETRIRREYDTLSYAYAERVRQHRSLQEGTSELLSEEESLLSETFKELEVLGAKLEYEMGSLVSKVEDVEDGVADFERQVDDLEARIEAIAHVEVKGEGRPFWRFGW